LTGSLTASGGVGALLQIYDSTASKTLLPTYDGNGNVAALLNAETGGTLTLEAAYEYDPYGNLLRNEGSYATSNPFRFSTKYTDVETGLIFYGRRYYSPTLGRFISRDPKEESGGLNLYGFVGNNAINRWDYLGMVEIGMSISLPTMVVTAPSGGGGFGGFGSFSGFLDGFGSGFGSQASQSDSGGSNDDFVPPAEGTQSWVNGVLYIADKNGLFQKAAPYTDVPLNPTTTPAPTYGTLELPTFRVNGTRPSAPDFNSYPLPTTVTVGDYASAIGNGALNFFIGGGEALGGIVTGTVNTVLHPIDTVQNTADGLGTIAGLLSTRQGRADINDRLNYLVNTGAGAQQLSRGVGGLTIAVLGTIAGGRLNVPTEFERHHTIPSEILRRLPPDVANNPLVRGRAGAPNRWSIPRDLHRQIHSGGPRGGNYNEFFRRRLRDIDNPTVDDLLSLREDAVKEFGLGKYRPQEP
jgi:RHS repeat-associated protein